MKWKRTWNIKWKLRIKIAGSELRPTGPMQLHSSSGFRVCPRGRMSTWLHGYFERVWTGPRVGGLMAVGFETGSLRNMLNHS